MKTVLIVDDSNFIRLSVRTILEKNGFSVIGEASNGVEAIAKYMQLHPDIVTMDITMPDMEGLDALEAIIGYDPDAKVVMLSAMGHETKVKKSIISGARNFIVKPFKEEHLLKVLNQL